MRPTWTIPFAVAWLLVSASPCALAQSTSAHFAADRAANSSRPTGDENALPRSLPLMSTGRPATGQSTPFENVPASGLRDETQRADETRQQLGSGAHARSGTWPLSQATSPTPDPAAPFGASPGQNAIGQSTVVRAQFTSSDPPPATLPKSPTQRSNPTAEILKEPSPNEPSPKEVSPKEPRALKPPSKSDSEPENKRSSGTVQMFISVVSSLLIVIGLLLGAAWCYRKASPNSSATLPKQVIQILGRTPLAPRQQLVLLRFGPKLLLVSNLQGEVRTISEIDDPLEVDRVAGLCESSQAGSISDSFRSVLHNIGRTG